MPVLSARFWPAFLVTAYLSAIHWLSNISYTTVQLSRATHATFSYARVIVPTR
jgi:hypothetical protein